MSGDQPALFDVATFDVAPEVAILERRGVFTAARFKTLRPDRYEIVLRLLERGIGVLAIADVVGCSSHTVQAVRDDNPERVAIGKERLAGGMLGLVGLLRESLEDDVSTLEKASKIPFRDRTIAAGVFTDKALVLQGEANVIHGVAGRDRTAEEYLQAVAITRKRGEGKKEKAVEAEFEVVGEGSAAGAGEAAGKVGEVGESGEADNE